MGKLKNNKFIKPALAALLAVFIITACNPADSVAPIEDLIDEIPGMSLIDGAENVTITVNKNNTDAYYNVLLSDLDAEAIGLAGDYKAWCTQWDINIGSNNAVYQAARVYDIAGEGYWKNVVYLVNNAGEYIAADSTLKWTEIQVAVWAMINHKKIELSSQFISGLEPVFSDVRLDVVEQIISDVEVSISGWDFDNLTNDILYVEVADDVQDLVIVRPKQ